MAHFLKKNSDKGKQEYNQNVFQKKITYFNVGNVLLVVTPDLMGKIHYLTAKLILGQFWPYCFLPLTSKMATNRPFRSH